MRRSASGCCGGGSWRRAGCAWWGCPWTLSPQRGTPCGSPCCARRYARAVAALDRATRVLRARRDAGVMQTDGRGGVRSGRHAHCKHACTCSLAPAPYIACFVRLRSPARQPLRRRCMHHLLRALHRQEWLPYPLVHLVYTHRRVVLLRLDFCHQPIEDRHGFSSKSLHSTPVRLSRQRANSSATE